MVNVRHTLTRVAVLAFLLAPVSLQAVEERALLGRMDSSRALTELLQQQQALQEMATSPFVGAQDKNAKRDLKKRESELKRAITKEQARIKEVGRACKDLFAKGKKDVLTATDKQGRTLLMLVASLGVDEATEMVLADDPALDAIDKEGRTALSYETESGGTAVRKKIDDAWVNAVGKGDADTVGYLMDCGCSASDAVNGEPPLAIAIRNNYGPLMSLLAANQPGTVARTQEGYTLLELAARCGNANAVTTLLSIGADDGSNFSTGATPLFYMAAKASPDCFDAYINTSRLVDRDSLTTLITRVGSAEKIRKVVKDADSANKEDPNGNIPIHEAARRGNVEVFRLLLNLGGSRTAQNKRGETTLMHAALSGNEDIIRLAMEGLDENALKQKDKKGATAADYAKRSGNRNALGLLEAAGLKSKK